jgi:transcriptional activator SPT7
MNHTPSRQLPNGIHHHSALPNGAPRRAVSMTRDGAYGSRDEPPASAAEGELPEDPVHSMLKQRWAETEANIAKLFGTDGQGRRASKQPVLFSDGAAATSTARSDNAKTPAPPKRSARQIDDDYGDDDDDEDEEPVKESPLKAKAKTSLANGLLPAALRSPIPSGRSLPGIAPTSTPSEPAKSSEDVRKQLEEDKKAAEEAAKRSFQSMFFTLEHDRDAMLEQQKLDELDREVENEISGGPNGAQSTQQGASNTGAATGTQGTLGSADLGASSLTLKHLIARIDQKRDMVRSSDNQLRTLISEVRKGRSKWASEDKVGQEELYEASEKVLMELKAQTDYAQPFLQRVSKREAPDYFNVIKHPMDIGTMLKKLKQLGYKSKKEFVDDLNLIWANCLKYNQDPQHPLRKKALYMRKETDKLTPLIPDITIRDRAEMEAEERRLHSVGDDDSDDDDAPIMASRGRKAPKKGVPSSTKRAPTVAVEEPNSSSTPAPDVKPPLPLSASNLRTETLRAESELHDASSTGFGTPPPGSITPLGINGIHSSAAPGSQADATEIDGIGNSIIASTHEDEDEEDTEFKTWKQVTKRDRAQAAAERHRLFRGDQFKNLNAEEPALLRNKAMMRRWIRQQKMTPSEKPTGEADATEGDETSGQPAQGESLAEGIEKDQDSTLPDYYTSLSAIPNVDERLKWVTDSEGAVVPQTEEWMRMFPRDTFISGGGSLANKMEANMRQMQETRKVCAKIGIVKQMQIQAQVSIAVTALRGPVMSDIPRRPTKTNSPSTSHNHYLSRMSALSLSRKRGHSWLRWFVALLCNDQWARSSIMLASRTFNLLPLMLSLTWLPSTSASSLKHAKDTTNSRRWTRRLRSIHPRSRSCIRCTSTDWTWKRSRHTSRTMSIDSARNWVLSTSA